MIESCKQKRRGHFSEISVVAQLRGVAKETKKCAVQVDNPMRPPTTSRFQFFNCNYRSKRKKEASEVRKIPFEFLFIDELSEARVPDCTVP